MTAALAEDPDRLESMAARAMMKRLGRPDEDWRAFTSQINVPTLLVHGARSVAVPPASGEWLRDSIPGSRLLVFEDSGHAPF